MPSTAHFTRVGNWETPEKTANLSSSAQAEFLGDPSPDGENVQREFALSRRVFPFTMSVITDAEDLEIAQPFPSKLTS